MHTLWRKSHYIDLSRLFAHFGNGCQWGRSFEGLRELGFMLLTLCQSICPSCFASCCLAWLNIQRKLHQALIANICNGIQSSFTRTYIMGEFALCIQLVCYLNSLYKPSQRDCHQLPKWGRLKEHGDPMCGFGN